jgi:uncharacterized protein YprB with RNaseH-like and TPR domain
MRIITFDVEIKAPIVAKSDWDAARRGEHGVSTAVLFDTQTERYHLYGDFPCTLDANRISDMIDHLNQADLLVGFNSNEFDIPCLEGYTMKSIDPPRYDILQEIWGTLRTKTKGWGLDPLCMRTLGIGKPENTTGESAPELYKQGRYAQLFDYNLNDVFITRKLFSYIMRHGKVVRPDGAELSLPRRYPNKRA